MMFGFLKKFFHSFFFGNTNLLGRFQGASSSSRVSLFSIWFAELLQPLLKKNCIGMKDKKVVHGQQ